MDSTEQLQKEIRRLQCELEEARNQVAVTNYTVGEFVELIGENAAECFQTPAFLRFVRCFPTKRHFLT